MVLGAAKLSQVHIRMVALAPVVIAGTRMWFKSGNCSERGQAAEARSMSERAEWRGGRRGPRAPSAREFDVEVAGVRRLGDMWERPDMYSETLKVLRIAARETWEAREARAAEQSHGPFGQDRQEDTGGRGRSAGETRARTRTPPFRLSGRAA